MESLFGTTINNNDLSVPVSLRQSAQFKNRQSNNKHKKKNKVTPPRMVLEGFDGSAEYNDLYKNNDDVMENTKQVLNKGDNIYNAKTAEFKQLQTQHAALSAQYDKIQTKIMTMTRIYANTDRNGIEGKNVFVNTAVANPTSSYQGAFKDKVDSPAMTVVPGGNAFKYEDCQKKALDSGNTFFGMQSVNSSGVGQCATSNDLQMASQYGQASSETCKLGNDGNMHADNESNAIYQLSNSQYIGTFKDSPNRAMPTFINGGSQSYNYDTCKSAAKAGGYKFFALQNAGYYGGAQCAVSNDYNKSISQGETSNKFTAWDGNIYGGGWANALYTTEGNSKYVGCYKNPGNNSSMYQLPNYYWFSGKEPTFAQCQTLMETYNVPFFGIGKNPAGITNCSYAWDQARTQQNGLSKPTFTGTDGKVYGSSGTNAVYKLDTLGDNTVVGKIGYVDEDKKVSEYPGSMTNNGKVVNGSNSCPADVTQNIDSIAWSNLTKTGSTMSSSTQCGLAGKIAADKQQLNVLKQQLANVAAKITASINTMESYNSEAIQQMGIDKTALLRNLDKYPQVKNEYKHYINSLMPNIDGILSDTDINVLQENYTYTSWSILAIALVIITMVVVIKK